MVLFSIATCPYSHRVRIVLAEKDITADIVDVDSDNKPDDLLLLNPYNTVPTLVDRDLVLYDSRVIIEYLDERFPHPPLMPVDPVSRARSRLALYRIENDWFPMLHELETAPQSRAEQLQQQMRESLLATAEVFAAKPFFLSDEFSLVDASMAPLLWRLKHFDIELGKQGKPIHDYARNLFEREAFRHSLTEAELEMR